MARPGVYVTESVLTTPIANQTQTTSCGALIAALPSGPVAPTLVNSWYQFTSIFGGLDSNYSATFAANMFFRSGGRDMYVSRVTLNDAVKASAVLKSSVGTTAWLTFTAKGKGTYGNSLRVVITLNSSNLYDVSVIKDAGVADTVVSGAVTAGTDDDTILESYSNLNLAQFNNAEVVSIFAVRSQYLDVAWNSGASALLITPTLSTIPLTGGTDGSTGTYDYPSALTALSTIDRSLVLFSPGIVDTTTIAALVAAAETNKWFVVLDTAVGLSPANAVTYAGTLASSTYAAVYYPHLWVTDSTSASRDAVKLMPPSGAVAGIYLSTDSVRGVFKAPAGIEAVIPGVVALERNLTSAELDALNNDVTPVNAIRNIAGVGPAVMGARTLKQSTSLRYVNIRRSLTHVNREMKNRLEFAIYRNNDILLWTQMRTVLDSFLVGFWTAGGLRGGTKAQAYYIKIDSENNSPADVANGIVNVEVGLALQYPAEFIRVKLTQQTLS